MSDDANARRDDSAAQADDRFVEALLEASKPEEAVAAEARIRRGMATVRDVGPVAVASNRRWWAMAGGLGSIAAVMMLAVFFQTSEVRADRIIARVLAAESAVTALRFDVRLEGPEGRAGPDLEGSIDLLARPNGHPLLRFEVDRPADRSHAWGVDARGGWGRSHSGIVSRFARTAWSTRIMGDGLDLLVDAIPGLLDRVAEGYELTTEVDPVDDVTTLIAVKRETDDGSKSPNRIRIEVDPNTDEVRRLVLEWDQEFDPAERRWSPSKPEGGPDRGRPGGDGPPMQFDRRPPPPPGPAGGPGERRRRPPPGRPGPGRDPLIDEVMRTESQGPARPPARITFERVPASAFTSSDFLPTATAAG
ncbi:MAG: hypothetical protein P8P71_10500 [Phycisphaerales bacterium]|nr:hypothetical protein [Phycisphaerales bacterium]